MAESAKKKYDRQAIREFIVAYKTQHGGLSPTYAEIMAAFEVSSTSVMAYILTDMQSKGLITLQGRPGQMRGIGIPGEKWMVTQ
ncbi:MAG TPA: hypothetical protein PLT26_16370 [Anaerolineaceae bacterium]|jgi:SOS-response transcriptional repressor LexA|nr:hypothetical protein [Anaerolineaceae bacterium]